MLALFCVAFALTSCSSSDDNEPYNGPGDGSKKHPYSVAEAIDVAKSLTWTSDTEYEKTGEVYVKGKISRIISQGRFSESEARDKAMFFISEDGTPNNEFFCYNILYFGKKSYKPGQTDIKIGDEVIICGKLVNYKGEVPQTLEGEAWLYSLNGATGGGSGDEVGDGSKAHPYTVAGALEAARKLTWTSKDVYDKSGNVYVKGIISRISYGGLFTEGGTYGNATFYISDDGTDLIEFRCFRILYFEGKKYKSGQTDIKVGDEVIVYGKLMNYKGNTPQTVADEAWLYMLNNATDGGSGSAETVSFATNSETQTWTTATDATYGAGFSTTTEGLNIGFYKHTCSMNLPAPSAKHVRIYTNSVLSIASTEGKKIKKIVIGCAPDAGTTSYCNDMAGLEGSANAVADKSALTVTWTGSASKVVLQANNGQVRMEKLTVVFE